MKTVEIIDCVAKSKMIVQKYGRDCMIKIVDMNGKVLFYFVMEMKRYEKFKEIEQLFVRLKKLIVERARAN